MRHILTIFILLLLSVAAPADEEDGIDTLGKSDAEILAMGQSRWFDFFTSNSELRDSTAGMVQAFASFAAAASRRNASLPDRHYAAELAPLLRRFAERSLDIAYNYSGGGTMWIPLYGEMACDLEEAVFALLGGELPAAEATMTGPVNRALAQLDELIEQTAADPEATWFKADEARAALRSARADWQRIKALAAGLDRPDSDHVLSFCLEWATAIEIAMEGC